MIATRDYIKNNWLFNLSAYLSKSDKNYVGGRILWEQWMLDSAGNLLWLSIEQLVKIIVVQDEIDFQVYLKQKEYTTLERNLNNTQEFCKIISSLFRRINGNHSVQGLIDSTSENLNKLLNNNINLLNNINILYQNRYYISQNRTTQLNMVDEIDELYFNLRSMINENIPRSYIDEILFYKECANSFILGGHFLYSGNKFIKSRKYPPINTRMKDGTIISYDGETKKLLEL